MVKIAVISDVHAFEPEPQASDRMGDPSWVRTTDGPSARRAPFHALERLIREEDLSADYLVCCGDMGDKADSAGIAYTWGWLETVRRRLDAHLTVATTGNHDVDSYDTSRRHEPRVFIRSLQPPYPVDNALLAEEYWQNHVIRIDEPEVDLVVLDTCAEHENREQAERGRVTDETLDRLRDTVAECKAPLRILIGHHHPYRHDAIDRTDYSELDGGPEVLSILQSNGDWLVVHGHRHYPTMAYAAGTASSPIIFAAGSFSAFLYPDLQTRVRNQFHILDVDAPGTIPGTAGVTGLVQAWEYNAANGWVQPHSEEGIPDGAGFGYRGSTATAASLCEQSVQNHARESFVTLDVLFAENPALRYMLPTDRSRLLKELSVRGVTVSPQNNYWLHEDEIFLRKTP